MLGLLTGSILFGATYPYVFPTLSQLANYGSVTLPELWNVSPVLLIAVIAVFVVILFYFLERGLKREDTLDSEE